MFLAVVAEKNEINKDQRDDIKKMAPLLRDPFFGLSAAADYLESWVAGRLEQQPLLAVHSCSGQIGLRGKSLRFANTHISSPLNI